MDRVEWLAERRRLVVSTYDEGASTYDDIDYPRDTQAVWVAGLVSTVPPDGVVLDAACGTGRYFSAVTGTGRHVVGIDQSAGMLGRARARRIADSLHHVGLQELALDSTFDAVMCIDAMENVAPEDWPVVITNLHRALRPGGHLYLTVEELDAGRLDAAFATLAATATPAIRGEVVEGDVAGYHFYPGRDRVGDWLEHAGFRVVDEQYTQHDGWGYRHLLVVRP